MKKALTASVAALALAAMLLVGVTTASAHPSKTSACTGCHSRKTSVKITLTRVSATSTTVTYKIKVTGGSGTAGWAVLAGGKNLAHKTASTGTFKLAKGKIVKVWAVKKDTGSNYKSLTAK
jgi:hypothetical protein